jgi:hypothetical protein
LAGNAVTEISLQQNGFEFSAGWKYTVIGCKVVDDYGSNKSIHRGVD